MQMKAIKYIFILSLILYGCKEETDANGVSATTYYDVPELPVSTKATQVKNIELRPYAIDPEIETSFQGYFWVHADSLYFSDVRFGYVFSFDANGKVANTYLGKGKGPNEIIGIESSTPTKEGFSVFYGGNNSLHTFDKNWKKLRGDRVDWGFTRKMEEVIKDPNPSMPESYEFDSGYENIIKSWDEHHVAVALSASHPKFNGYFDSELYYNYSRILALVNTETGKIDEFVGRRSPFYLKHLSLPIFDHFSYEPTQDKVYLNFWPDTNIYVLNKETRLAIGKFGKEGRDMNVAYTPTNSYNDATKKHYDHRKKYGYYKNLKYVPKKGLLFRGYAKGNDASIDGLQIYEKHTLVGDFDVPKNFEVLGSIGDTIIGFVAYNEEGFQVFKIKLNYEN